MNWNRIAVIIDEETTDSTIEGLLRPLQEDYDLDMTVDRFPRMSISHPSYPLGVFAEIIHKHYLDTRSEIRFTVPAKSDPVFASLRICVTWQNALRCVCETLRDARDTLSLLEKRVYLRPRDAIRHPMSFWPELQP